MTQKKTSIHKWIMLATAVLSVALTKLLLPPAGLGEAGFQILGILAAAIILFLSWGHRLDEHGDSFRHARPARRERGRR